LHYSITNYFVFKAAAYDNIISEKLEKRFYSMAEIKSLCVDYC